MIPSADNIADYLARWDAGSIPAFVKKMNAMARALGLKDTHYARRERTEPGVPEHGSRSGHPRFVRDERARHDLGRRSPDHGLPRRG